MGNAGGINFTTGTHDDIGINVQWAGGLSFSGDFQDGTSFLPNQTNVNNPDVASLIWLVLPSGTWNSYFGSASFGANPTKLTTNAAAVPGPVSFALLGTGLIGLGAMRRRRAGDRIRKACRRV